MRGLVACVVLIVAVALGYIYISSEPHVESILVQALDGVSLAFRETSVVTDIVNNLKLSQPLQEKRCLVTGGNRGLGKSVSTLLHEFGCKTVVATRSVAEAVALTPTHNAELIKLDLASFASICSAASAAESFQEPFDVIVLNAGVAPYQNDRTVEGFEQALGTNCVGNTVLTAALWKHNLIAKNGKIVIVNSETHRAVPDLDLEHLFDPVDYGLAEAMDYYARSKLCLTTMAQALVPYLSPHNISVHTICPGPVATDIARGAPGILRNIIEGIMATAFQTPASAARPVALTASLAAFAGPSGSNHHMYKMKPARVDTRDTAKQAGLWALLWAQVARQPPACLAGAALPFLFEETV